MSPQIAVYVPRLRVDRVSGRGLQSQLGQRPDYFQFWCLILVNRRHQASSFEPSLNVKSVSEPITSSFGASYPAIRPPLLSSTTSTLPGPRGVAFISRSQHHQPFLVGVPRWRWLRRVVLVGCKKCWRDREEPLMAEYEAPSVRVMGEVTDLTQMPTLEDGSKPQG